MPTENQFPCETLVACLVRGRGRRWVSVQVAVNVTTDAIAEIKKQMENMRLQMQVCGPAGDGALQTASVGGWAGG